MYFDICAIFSSYQLFICHTIGMDKMTLGQVIKHLRNEKNMTQEQLIEKAELTRSQLYYIEADKRGIRLTTLFSICNGLGVSLVEFASYLDDSLTPSISSIDAPGATIG